MNRHPEQRDGEIFLGNFEKQNFPLIGWLSKRDGQVAYSTDGRSVRGLVPVFISRAEVEAQIEKRHARGGESAKQGDRLHAWITSEAAEEAAQQ